MKSNEKGFCRDISSKRKARENVVPLLNGTRDLVMNEIKKAELLNVSFTLVFSGRTFFQESQPLRPVGHSGTRKTYLPVEKNQTYTSP